MNKKLLDYFSIFCIFLMECVLAASYIYKLRTGNPAINFLYIIIGILILFFAGAFIINRLCGLYREKAEIVTPFWFYFITCYIWEFLIHFTLDKVNDIIDNAVNITTASWQIIMAFAVNFIIVLIVIKAEVFLEKKYQQYKKSKKSDI